MPPTLEIETKIGENLRPGNPRSSWGGAMAIGAIRSAKATQIPILAPVGIRNCKPLIRKQMPILNRGKFDFLSAL
jgi:hypothetical protein